MQVTLRHNPSFSVARAELAGGERIRVEAGAMMAMSDGMHMDAKMEGGFLKSLKRGALGGESFFITTYTAPEQGGWIDLAANLPGDLVVTGVTQDQPMFVTAGSWIASDAGVEFDTKWGGFKNLFGGEGGFVGHVTGHGTIVVSAYGAIDTVSLQPGERVTIDTGHAVAWGATVTFQIRSAGGGLGQMVKSAEGLLFEFTGPGWVMTQSRNPQGLISYLTANMPASRA
jgi:uncharacterized protein (TIGR00266 family)